MLELGSGCKGSCMARLYVRKRPLMRAMWITSLPCTVHGSLHRPCMFGCRGKGWCMRPAGYRGWVQEEWGAGGKRLEWVQGGCARCTVVGPGCMAGVQGGMGQCAQVVHGWGDGQARKRTGGHYPTLMRSSGSIFSMGDRRLQKVWISGISLFSMAVRASCRFSRCV